MGFVLGKPSEDEVSTVARQRLAELDRSVMSRMGLPACGMPSAVHPKTDGVQSSIVQADIPCQRRLHVYRTQGCYSLPASVRAPQGAGIVRFCA